MLEYTAKQKRSIDCYIHVGDMAYTKGTDVEFQGKFFSVYSPLLRNTVCWPSMGNHEGHSSDSPSQTGPKSLG